MAQTDQNDPYGVLGVAKTATDDEIKKAYRKLARELHPDLTGGDTAKSERFKAVSAAYDLLRDAERRRRFDAGEIDASGQERPQRQYYRSHAEADPSQRYEFSGDFDDLGDIFARAFRDRSGPGGPGSGGFGGAGFDRVPLRGRDLHFHLEVSFLDALTGAGKTVTLPESGTLEIKIPPGIEDGQTLRLSGKGGPGANGGPPGDALVRVSVRPDPVFTRDGDDVTMELPISIDEAVLGASVEIPVPGGRVKLKVPPNSSSGRVMRLRGKGVARRTGTAGDLRVTLRIVLPEAEDPSLADAVRTWRAAHVYDPRAGWEGAR
ncbi:MAG: DnaJ domain-containing protein [Rhodobacteraceae bacterium]|nr:DnaJ domain-containing protein [Paracoccaceae bacterium]